MKFMKKLLPARLLRGSKIPNRLLLSFLLLSLIPLTVTGYFSYKQSSDAIESKIGTYSSEIMKLLQQTIRVEVQKVDLLSNQVVYQNFVQKALHNYSDLDEWSKWSLAMDINALLSDKSTLIEHIKTMKIYTKSGDLLYDLGYELLRDEDTSRWMQEIDQDIGKDIWTYARTVKGTNCILFGRMIYSQSVPDTPLGYVMIALDEAFFYKIYRDTDMGTGSAVSMLDADGTVLSSMNPDLVVGRKPEDPELAVQLSALKNTETSSFPVGPEENRKLAAFTYDPVTDWYVVSLIPFSYLNMESDQFLKVISIVGLILFICCLILALLISRSISQPLNRLVGKMRLVMKGDFDVVIHDNYQDELGYLSRMFNLMLKQIRRLIQQVKDEQEQKRETEIQMLQAQINPHFLFNTLNSLKWTAMLSQADSVSRGLGALAELLRNTIVDKKELVTLWTEIRNIENYVIIQRVRYGTSFTVAYDIPEELYECRMLKFLLQPIVENSIIHGLEGQEAVGHILIECRKSADELRIRIRDDGQGMDPGTVRELLGQGPDRRFAGIGVTNVAERIRLNFGESYGLKVHSEVGQGTEVTLTLPYITEVEDEHEKDERIGR
ncbi:sensor histidine kinase [Paenibacillus sp. FJAT-26967]|uniref:cache domain-containing sensor histidine kinase n=1 Tax=Paenibacillus sp. FJAT-26967 TaxID=1729690 RepID=UPI0008391406|nr:sensor histidine kinase [Paenibacillus sp. FJAT-26967]